MLGQSMISLVDTVRIGQIMIRLGEASLPTKHGLSPKTFLTMVFDSQGQATPYMDVSHLVNQQGQSHNPAKL